MAKGIYIAGAGKDAGKTTLCLGLLSAFREILPRGVSFIKPLGQKTTLVQGEQVGQDSWFVDRALGLNLSLEKAAPFAASSGAASRYIRTGEPSGLPGRIRRAYRAMGGKGRLVLVEGTGHPGVGSVFDMSNARTAKVLETPVLLVLDGGVGSTVDRFNLCASMFHHYDVPVLGVVINKVLPSKMEKVKELLGKWFGDRGIPVFGYVPYEDSIARPSLGVMKRALGAEPVIELNDSAEHGVAGHLAAFGSADSVLRQVGLEPGKTVLVDHTRPDVLDALVVCRMSGSPGPGAVIVCGGDTDARRREAFRKAGIPLYVTETAMETSAGRLTRRIFKVEPHEDGKIRRIVELIGSHVDAKAIASALEPDDPLNRGKDRGFFGRMFHKVFRR